MKSLLALLLFSCSSRGPTTTYETIKNGLKVSAGPEHFEGKFDGKDYPVQEDHITRMTISKDGKSMRVESTDKQRAGTMTYTTAKLFRPRKSSCSQLPERSVSALL